MDEAGGWIETEATTEPAIAPPLEKAVTIFASWMIALFEYSLMVPANRIGYGAMTLPQLKIVQEVITLSVFIPFALFYMHVPFTWNYLWAGCCLLGAVYFISGDRKRHISLRCAPR